MLYVIHGTDTKKVKSKASQLVEMLQKKRPDAALLKVDSENWKEGIFNEIIPSVSLFSPKNIIVLTSLLEDDLSEKEVIENLQYFKDTEHVCVLVEGKVTKENLKKISSKAEKIEEHNLREAGATRKESPQTFALADALVQKNNRKAFEIFNNLREEKLAAEEIHGVIWWQFKSLAVALKAKSAKEADLNPFVYSKCKATEKHWSEAAISVYLERLVDMYHKAHKGEVDFMTELEVLCLS